MLQNIFIKRNDSIPDKSNMRLYFQKYIQLYIWENVLLCAKNCACEDIQL